jgi:uncharacterized protein (TIGR00725 family)
MGYQVAVCGPASCSTADAAAAREVGRLLAGRGAAVLCGGTGTDGAGPGRHGPRGAGVMAAVAGGAHDAGGLVIGILPGDHRRGAVAGLDAVVLTGLGQARNAVLVNSADAVIVIGGSWGTLSELGLARRRGLPVVSLRGWRIVDDAGAPVDDGIVYVTDAAAAVQAALAGPG